MTVICNGVLERRGLTLLSELVEPGPFLLRREALSRYGSLRDSLVGAQQ